MSLYFRVRKFDASARLSELRTSSGTLVLPEFFPVYNPNKPTVDAKEMSEMGIRGLITNSYFIYRDPKLREIALEKGIHSLLDFRGIVMTDSGAYQIYRYGAIEVSNREILEFQHAIGSDIGSIVDVPMSSEISREESEAGVERTIKHAEEWASMRDELSGTLWVGTPQGSVYRDLVAKCSKRIKELDFHYNGVGSIKIALESYDFATQADHFMLVRSLLQAGKPFHFWGIGHPSTFAFFAAMGADSFDSASYSLYAEQDRYMTPSGTLLLNEIEEFPCLCPICLKYAPSEVRELSKKERTHVIAKHNLYVCLSEIRKVREAIRGDWLWELVQERSRFHPNLYFALITLLRKYGRILELREPLFKSSGLQYSGPEAFLRPEVVRARERIKRVRAERKFRRLLYGEVPLGLKYTYPFGQTVCPYDSELQEEPSDSEVLSAVLSYQFDFPFPQLDGVIIRRSKSTGTLREVKLEGMTIGHFRPSDGAFIPTLEGASLLLKHLPYPIGRVVVRDPFADIVARGTTVFVKFLKEADPNIRPKSEVIIVSEGDELLATGKALLSSAEYSEYHQDHPFVVIRRHSKDRTLEK
ncbi:MAG: tRNA guanosine(15) transglycosylase TgtA [Candidatus Korarchaeum sp.]|nr:tRNA guanosine(15) transglycosylase TgtA [Candidatus Korarchaeum sp.]MDW8036155.1 tRNA guanosine(15) transglycosylase TgtA [Candidatus Korarchaeum sp.]